MKKIINFTLDCDTPLGFLLSISFGLFYECAVPGMGDYQHEHSQNHFQSHGHEHGSHNHYNSGDTHHHGEANKHMHQMDVK